MISSEVPLWITEKISLGNYQPQSRQWPHYSVIPDSSPLYLGWEEWHWNGGRMWMFGCLSEILLSSLTKKGSATYNYFPLKSNSDTLHAERFEHSWKAQELSTLMDIVCSEARSMVKLRQRTPNRQSILCAIVLDIVWKRVSCTSLYLSIWDAVLYVTVSSLIKYRVAK